MEITGERVLVSRLQHSELWLEPDGRWSIVGERAGSVIDDGRVLCMFGDEAFRRKDLLLSGQHGLPRLAALIGDRIVAAVAHAGWDVTRNDPSGFSARRNGDELAASASAGARITVSVTPSGLPTSAHVFDDVGAAERRLLVSAGVDALNVHHGRSPNGDKDE